MQRVMIIGGAGSGKSTLARMLGARTDLPVFHMDHIHWKSGWIERTQDEKYPLIRDIITRDAWILEGNHSRTFSERLARADTCIWLDVPVALRLWRVVRRSILQLGRTRPDMPENCPEQLHMKTLTFIAYIWRTRHSSRIKNKVIADDPPRHLTVHHLQNLDEVRAFLKIFLIHAEEAGNLRTS